MVCHFLYWFRSNRSCPRLRSDFQLLRKWFSVPRGKSSRRRVARKKEGGNQDCQAPEESAIKHAR